MTATTAPWAPLLPSLAVPVGLAAAGGDLRVMRSIAAMSFVQRLLGIRGTPGVLDNAGSGEVADDDFDPAENCPYCRQPVSGFRCFPCGSDFVLENNDRLVDVELSQQGARSERRCERCDRPLTRHAEFTAAWQDGSNPEAYITCPSCRHSNTF